MIHSLKRLVRMLLLTVVIKRQYRPLLRAEFSESDLFSQCNSLFEAGYREAAVVVGCTAIRRRLKEILKVCPVGYYDYLPKKTSSRSEYATFELAYLFYNKGLIDRQLRRDLGMFQKNVSQTLNGVMLSRKKAEKMLSTINEFRPRLDEAMGRARLMLPALERKPDPQQPSHEEIDHLGKVLPVALDHWCRKVLDDPSLRVFDPITLIQKLRERQLITKRQFRVARRLFLKPQWLEFGSVEQLRKLYRVAQQATLPSPQPSDESNGHPSQRDARLVEGLVRPSSSTGGAPCPR